MKEQTMNKSRITNNMYDFEKDLNFFIANQESLVSEYNGKVLVIKNQNVIGVYENILEAYLKTQENHQLGTFTIQPCFPGKDAYTVLLIPH